MDSIRPKKRSLWRNWVSYSGGLAVAGGLVLIALGLLWQLTLTRPGPYSGILTFVLFPSFVLLGIGVVLLGMLLESRRRRRTGKEEARPYPALDLNDPKQRARFRLVAVAGMVVFAAMIFSGYHGFLLTESVGFCGNTCHTQMGPEMTAYQHSPHADVPCVDCHVGGGAGHYVQSKLNGTRQLFEVVFHTYDRPIPTPVKGLRPARETCEECHWSEKNWGSQLYQRAHFRYDEKSTPEQISMLVRTGGGKGPYGGGIHWHMFVENQVTYVALDKHLQDIPWVRVKHPDGSVTEYSRTEKPVDAATIAKLKHRTMDCMDCHNRPAHDFETPDVAVDRALAAGVFSPTLPYAKALSVETLSKDYPTRAAAHDGMTKAVKSFYATKYPDVASGRAADVDKLVAGLLEIYDRNVFPEMKVSFSTYESNIGHRNSPGCFRCHDGKHVSPDGKVLVSECKACHTTPQRGPQTGMGESTASTDESWHPWQPSQKYLEVTEHKSVQCWECHLDGRKPKTQCNECHGR
jgi:hypothetical protein